MEKILDSIRKSLENKNWHSALVLSLIVLYNQVFLKKKRNTHMNMILIKRSLCLYKIQVGGIRQQEARHRFAVLGYDY